MALNTRIVAAIGLVAVAFAPAPRAATITVGKSGAQYSTIMAAVSAAKPGDVVEIMDAGVYEEQVTIDSTKYPLTLTSHDPSSLTKPRVRYQDKINVGPKTYADSKDPAKLTFDRNGALRIIRARGVVINGIAIDGGGVFPFGYPRIWEQNDPLQFGNCALTIWSSGDVIVRNCDISNAYIGINFKDRNIGGIFSNPNPSDLDTSLIIPMSGYGLMGGHLIERNRIHNNSFAIFSESSWDMGSTIRYNLIYENHHPTSAVATQVYGLTAEGTYHPGGAFCFKDIQLSPLAIYNNTFWHNFIIFAGHWQAGYQHLIFNNIFGPPHKYWEESSPSFATKFMELTPMLTNRVTSCVFSAQFRAPQADTVRIMETMPTITGTGGAAVEPGKPWVGEVGIQGGFPAAAENRWLEMDTMKFLSLDPASANFLEPNWADAAVQNFIRQKGWQASGVKNTDGTWADLGAIEQAHGMPAFTGTVKPLPLPVIVNGSTAQVTFTVSSRIGPIKDPVVKLFRLVKVGLKTGSFGTDAQTLVIGSSAMNDLTVPASPAVKVGLNSYSVTVPALTDYAFIEMVVEASGAEGRIFTLAPGFLPYRKLDYKLGVEIREKTGTGSVLSEVAVGDTVQLRLLPQKIDGTSFTSPLDTVSVALMSGFGLMAPGDPQKPLVYHDGIPGGPDNKLIVFTKAPEGGVEYVSVTGVGRNPTTKATFPFIGGTSVKLLSFPTSVEKSRGAAGCRALFPRDVMVTCYDLQGRRVFQKTFREGIGTSMPVSFFMRKTPGPASKVYLVDISVKEGLSLKKVWSGRKVTAR